MISEQFQKEALLYPFCQDFAVSNVIIHFSEQLAMDDSVKHGSRDVVNVLNKYRTTYQLSADQAAAEPPFDFVAAELERSIDHPL